MTVRRLSPYIGGEISGIDLPRELSDEQVANIYLEAVWDYFPQTSSGYRVQIEGTRPPIPA